MMTQMYRAAEPLLVVVIDGTGTATISLRDDIAAETAVEWLQSAIDNLRQLPDTPQTASSDTGSEGTVQP